MAMGFKEAAKKVLESANKPLTAAEITEIALSKAMISTTGKTPSATMAAQIYIDIKNNPNSDFIKVDSGQFSLRSTKTSASGHEYVALHNEEIKKRLREHLFQIDPKEFEYLIGALLEKIGFENIEVMGGTGDGGIDLTADLTVGGVTNVKTEIQAKRYKQGNNIGSKIVRELRGSAEITKRGLIITTSDFSKDAVHESGLPNKMPISLINGERLIELLIENGVGVKKSQVEILSIDDDFLESIPEDSPNRIEHDVRSLSLWPLPGGITEYFKTLEAILRFVSSNSPTVEETAKWIMKSYPTVESFGTAKSYIGVPRSMKLIENTSGRLQLTKNGQTFLLSPTRKDLKSVLEESILGISEILEALEKQPMTEKEIWTYLNETLNLKWETYAQTRFRLIWLQNAGAVKKSDGGFFELIGEKPSTKAG